MRSHRVKRAYAFGSVCTEGFGPESDIDLLVAFDTDEPFEGYAENFWSLESALEKLLNRRVDIVTESQLQNPFIIENVNRTKERIYE